MNQLTSCEDCGETFTQPYLLKRHQQKQHGVSFNTCTHEKCGQKFPGRWWRHFHFHFHLNLIQFHLISRWVVYCVQIFVVHIVRLLLPVTQPGHSSYIRFYTSYNSFVFLQNAKSILYIHRLIAACYLTWHSLSMPISHYTLVSLISLSLSRSPLVTTSRGPNSQQENGVPLCYLWWDFHRQNAHVQTQVRGTQHRVWLHVQRVRQVLRWFEGKLLRIRS